MTRLYMNKKDFAASLDMSKSTFERRAKELNWVAPRGYLSIEYREEFIRRLKAWERKRLEEANKKRA
jgi:hypothetical protein